MSTEEIKVATENFELLDKSIDALTKVNFQDNCIAQTKQLELLKELQKLRMMEWKSAKEGL